jgi:hypothetical protein
MRLQASIVVNIPPQGKYEISTSKYQYSPQKPIAFPRSSAVANSGVVHGLASRSQQLLGRAIVGKNKNRNFLDGIERKWAS